jgi:hypothetical protein
MLPVQTLSVHLRVPVTLVSLVLVLHVLLGKSVPLERESEQRLLQQATLFVERATVQLV